MGCRMGVKFLRRGWLTLKLMIKQGVKRTKYAAVLKWQVRTIRVALLKVGWTIKNKKTYLLSFFKSFCTPKFIMRAYSAIDSWSNIHKWGIPCSKKDLVFNRKLTNCSSRFIIFMWSNSKLWFFFQVKLYLIRNPDYFMHL